MDQSILLVEGDEEARTSMVSYLCSNPRYPFHYSVEVAADFASGLEQLGRRSYDLIVLSLSLPDSKGIDGFYGLRAVVPTVPIVVLIDRDSLDIGRQSLEAGASDFILREEIGEGVLQRSVFHSVRRFRLKQELDSAIESSERAQKAKSDVLVNLSSEIHAPLYSVIRMTELVLGTRLASEQREYLESVSNSAYNLLTLVNDILDFSRIETGTIDLVPVEFKLREYISQVTGLLSDRAKKKEIQLDHLIDEGVPNRLKGDIDRLGQVLKNFIGNSITYARYGGQIALSVTTDRVSAKDVQLHFAVNLRGADIPLEKQKLIFESFAQADASTARKYGSMGLGLAVSSRLISLMGGRVWVEHESDQGVTFHFTAQFLINDREPTGEMRRTPSGSLIRDGDAVLKAEPASQAELLEEG